MNDIEKQIELIDWRNSEEAVPFYESNSEYFEGLILSNKIADRNKWLDLKLHYINGLLEKNHLDKLLAEIKSTETILIELGINRPHGQKDDQFLRFLKAIALTRKGNHRAANKIFKTLLMEDPENHLYQEWYKDSKIKSYTWIFSSLLVISVVLMIVDFLFLWLLDRDVNLLSTGIIILAISFFIKLAFEGYLKKRKTAPNNG